MSGMVHNVFGIFRPVLLACGILVPQVTLTGCFNPTGTGATGVTTGVVPEPTPLEVGCEYCEYPISVQHCWCQEDGENVEDYYGCPDDSSLESNSIIECGDFLNKTAVLGVDVFCEEEGVMCPQPSDLSLACAACNGEDVVQWHCKPTNNAEIWVDENSRYSCVGNTDMADFLQQKCADDLNMEVEEMRLTNFWTTTEECPYPPDEPTTGDPLLDCEDWVSSLAITHSGGVTYVDDAHVSALLDDPAALIFCDTTRFQALSPDGFEVQNVGLGDLFYELGLQDGDIPLTLNGLPLETFTDVVDALVQLWYVEGETDYELDVQRPFAMVALEFSLY